MMNNAILEEARTLIDDNKAFLSPRKDPKLYDQTVRALYMRLSREQNLHHNVARKYIYKVLLEV